MYNIYNIYLGYVQWFADLSELVKRQCSLSPMILPTGMKKFDA